MTDHALWIILGLGVYVGFWFIFDSYKPAVSRTTVGYVLASTAVAALIAIVVLAALVFVNMILTVAGYK